MAPPIPFNPGLERVVDAVEKFRKPLAPLTEALPTFPALERIAASLGRIYPAERTRTEQIEAPNPRHPAPEVSHDPEFCRLRVNGRTYDFPRPQQRIVIQALFRAWEAAGRSDGTGVSAGTLAKLVDSQAARFRVPRLFEGHKAWRTIVRPVGKGLYALYLSTRRRRATEGPKKDHTQGPLADRARCQVGAHGTPSDATPVPSRARASAAIAGRVASNGGGRPAHPAPSRRSSPPVQPQRGRRSTR